MRILLLGEGEKLSLICEKYQLMNKELQIRLFGLWNVIGEIKFILKEVLIVYLINVFFLVYVGFFWSLLEVQYMICFMFDVYNLIEKYFQSKMSMFI